MRCYLIEYHHDGGIGKAALRVHVNEGIALRALEFFRRRGITGVTQWTQEEISYIETWEDDVSCESLKRSV